MSKFEVYFLGVGMLVMWGIALLWFADLGGVLGMLGIAFTTAFFLTLSRRLP